MMDLQKEREEFEAWHYEQYLIENPNIDITNAKYIYDYAHKNALVCQLKESHFIAWQAAKAQAVPGWISVEDQLPDGGQTVVAIGFDWGNKANKRHFVICEYFDGIWVGDQDEEFEYLTHWMSLPDAPQESGND